ncbi:MAG: CDP-diacylglycerol--glycerol-3-phosphate 3-phosphatidyltransferase [Neisseriales bacterium]|nr:MAG: CDP-diacylglycerol--glycerol-3-phosphate 3-phosphatidyltransferase [Neisseriales bacterium]
MLLSIPNILTWLRIALLPAFVAIFYIPDTLLLEATKNGISVLLFGVAGFTDWLDGFLARKLGQSSAFGAFLDPVADKCMIVVALTLLVDFGRMPAVLAMIIISREIAVSALREWMAQIGQQKSVAVHWIGKFKTAMQITAIVVLLWANPLLPFVPTLLLGNILMWIAVLLTIGSMLFYLNIAIRESFDQVK